MPNKTTNYGLNKPTMNENVDINVLNENMDILDEALGNKADPSDIPTDDHINELIDAKLGVIESGSY